MPVIGDTGSNGKPKDNTPEVLAPFLSHGVYIKQRDGYSQAVGNCPFCGHESKLYVNPDNGLWDCKVCGKRGNPSDLLNLLWEDWSNTTTEDQYKEFTKERRYLFHESLVAWGAVYSSLRMEWVYPGYFQGSDRIKNLYRYTDYESKDGKRHLYSTKGCEHCLYGIRHFDDRKENVYICEGPGDAIALWEILRVTKLEPEGYGITGNPDESLLATGNVVAIPSANTFTETWARLLQDKNVYLLLDNDHPRLISSGKDSKKLVEPASYAAMRQITGKIVQWNVYPKSINYLAWGGDLSHDKELRAGYDVRDLLSEGYTEPSPKPSWRLKEIEKRTIQLDKLFNLIRPVPTKWIDPTDISPSGSSQAQGGKEKVGLRPLPCEKWQSVHDAMVQAYVWHKELDKTLASMLACVCCTMMPEDQMWLRIIAPASTGKTEMAMALGTNRKHVTLHSNFTGFFSGLRQTKDDAHEKGKKDDLSLLPQVLGKTMIIKDADTLLKNPRRDIILAELRDLYDGNTSTYFKNDTGKKYENLRVSVILIGTPSLYALDTNELGERFITCAMKRLPDELEQAIVLDSLTKLFRTVVRGVDKDKAETMDSVEKVLAKRLTAGYVDYLRKNFETLLTAVGKATDVSMFSLLDVYCRFVSYMRGRPSKSQDERAEREASTRLSKQLGKLAMGLAVVKNKDRVDDEIISMVRDIALDSSEGSILEITRHLYKSVKGSTYETIQQLMRHKDEKLKENLRYMVRIHAYRIEEERFTPKVTSGKLLYRLSPTLRALCDKMFGAKS